MSLVLQSQEESPTKLVTADQSAHWYSTDGEPYHTVPDANGNPRPTTLRDVRKLEKEGIHLLPSVTSVMILEKPELNAWKQTQILLAADNNPRQPGESIEDWSAKVMEESKTITRAAAEFGTRMHEVQEQILNLMHDGGPVLPDSLEIDEDLKPFAAPLIEKLNAIVVKTHWTEKVLVGPGYAGRADALFEHTDHGLVLADLKNRGWDPDSSRKPIYPTDGLQLAAYRLALGKKATCISIVCSSKKPAEPFIHVWDEKELEAALDAFHLCQKLWCWTKKFTPKGTAK